jgi:hypothetical protein
MANGVYRLRVRCDDGAARVTLYLSIPADQPDWLWFSIGMLYGIPIGMASILFWAFFWKRF